MKASHDEQGQNATQLTYADALKIAIKLKPNIDNCREHTDAFIFGSHADDMTIGGDGPCVVLKENGQAINMPSYLDRAGKFVREYAIDHKCNNIRDCGGIQLVSPLSDDTDEL